MSACDAIYGDGGDDDASFLYQREDREYAKREKEDELESKRKMQRDKLPR